MDVTLLPVITRTSLSKADRTNLKAAKAQVFDGLVQLVTPQSGDGNTRILAVGWSVENVPAWVGATFYCVPAFWDATLAGQLKKVLTGDSEMDRIVFEVEMLGGK